MSDLYLYNPDICDGDFCPQDCDRCYKREKAEEAAYEEPDDSQLEMGFDPYSGSYSYDC